MIRRSKIWCLICLVLAFICALLYVLFFNCYIIKLTFSFSFLFLIMFATLFFALFFTFCNILKKIQLKYHIFLFLFLLFTITCFSSILIAIAFKSFFPTIIIVEVSFVLSIVFGLFSRIEELKIEQQN